MSIMVILLIGVAAIAIIADIFLAIFWYVHPPTPEHEEEDLPKVSVLVAARNEEMHISRCMDHLLALDYPHDRIELLVGDDASTDETATIVKNYALQHGQLKVISITTTLGQAKGKANVLAHLAHVATGDYFFITDADTAVPPDWVKALLSGFGADTGIVTGVTGVVGAYGQHFDWMYALGMVKVITDLGQPVTAMGSNMAVTKTAYAATGGYENIPFSVTEDFELFRQIRAKGYAAVELITPEALAWTQPVQGIRDFLHQRKRWMKGVVQLPWPIVLLLALQAGYHIAILALFFLQPWIALILFIVRTSRQGLFIAAVQRRAGCRAPLKAYLVYPFYTFFFNTLSALFYFLPIKVRWKGRKY